MTVGRSDGRTDGRRDDPAGRLYNATQRNNATIQKPMGIIYTNKNLKQINDRTLFTFYYLPTYCNTEYAELLIFQFSKLQ